MTGAPLDDAPVDEQAVARHDGGKQPRHGGAGHQRVQREGVVVEALRGAGRRGPSPRRGRQWTRCRAARSPRGARACARSGAGSSNLTRAGDHLEAEPARQEPAEHSRRPVGEDVLAAHRPPQLGQALGLAGRQEDGIDGARRGSGKGGRDDPALSGGRARRQPRMRAFAPPPAKTTPSFAPSRPGRRAPRRSPRARLRRGSAPGRGGKPAMPLRTSGAGRARPRTTRRPVRRACARPVRARGTCIRPARPSSWSATLLIIRTPEAPTGCPQDLSPPEVLTGRSPPSRVTPAVASLCPSPAPRGRDPRS